MSAAIPVVVCFVIERDRHVLLLRRNAWKDEAPGQWETGSVEPGESLADAARREAREETGLEVEVLGELGAHRFLRDESGWRHSRSSCTAAPGRTRSCSRRSTTRRAGCRSRKPPTYPRCRSGYADPWRRCAGPP